MFQEKNKQTTAKVFVVDDHPAVREALTIRLARSADFELCGEAADTDEAMQAIEETKPDLAIIDISLKTGNGIDLIKRIKAKNNQVRILVWSMYNEDLYAERALRAGASGYITKEHATDQIIEALYQILEGKVYLSPNFSQKLLRGATTGDKLPSSGSPLEVLSDRELEVLRLIGHGKKTSEIASRLHLSPKTVETYRDRIRQKLGLDDGAALGRYAIQWMLENG